MDQSWPERPSDAVDLSIPSEPRSLTVVRAAVERMAKMVGFGEPDVGQIILAVDEALANVIKHSYRGATDQPIRVRLQPTKGPKDCGGLLVLVRDYGKAVDPATIQPRNLDDVRPGGLGVHIIRSVMDEAEYSCPESGGMQLRMVKYVRSEQAARG